MNPSRRSRPLAPLRLPPVAPRWLTGLLLLLLCSPGGCSNESPPAEPGSAAGDQAADRPTATPTTPLDNNAPQAESAPPPAQSATAADTRLTAEQVALLLQARLSAEQLEQGWVRLFDGLSLLGWEDFGAANWRVEQGTIVADSGETGLLGFPLRLDDFEIQLQFQAAANTNSGLFLRTPKQPTDPQQDCLEVNIAPPENPFPTGSLVARLRPTDTDFPTHHWGQWHHLHVRLQANHVQVRLDGQTWVDQQIPHLPPDGYIGLQFREGPIAFRDILIRPLASETILPSENLDLFSVPETDTHVRLSQAGELELVGGPGWIATKASWGDFWLHSRWQTLQPNTNSGIFFRCVPDSRLDGYELQIHNAYAESDRSQPLDSGTGAIFRRSVARAVLSDDAQTNFISLIAQGPQIATWVNGVPISQLTDRRPPDPNPRRGSRLEPGPLMLQAHDAQTAIRFEALSVSRLPAGTSAD
jgi:hypothetical protein